MCLSAARGGRQRDGVPAGNAGAAHRPGQLRRATRVRRLRDRWPPPAAYAAVPSYHIRRTATGILSYITLVNLMSRSRWRSDYGYGTV